MTILKKRVKVNGIGAEGVAVTGAKQYICESVLLNIQPSYVILRPLPTNRSESGTVHASCKSCLAEWNLWPNLLAKYCQAVLDYVKGCCLQCQNTEKLISLSIIKIPLQRTVRDSSSPPSQGAVLGINTFKWLLIGPLVILKVFLWQTLNVDR